MLSASLFSACDDDMAQPPLSMPSSDLVANTTIEELKQLYYQADNNYCTEVGTNAAGEDIIISGRVISSDKSGNVFKALFIEDETSAIQIRLDQYDLYESFQYGQDIRIKVTGLNIGAYGGLLQLGGPVNNGTPGRVAEADIPAHVQADGLADPDLITIYEVTIPELQTIIADKDEMLRWQSRLVKLDNVSFEGAGSQAFTQTGQNYTSRNITDADGNKVILYTSSYSDFAQKLMPTGSGSVIGMLSYFNGKWQIIINGLDDITGFDDITDEPGSGDKPGDNPSITPSGDGTTASPYNVARALELINGGNIPADKVYVAGTVSSITEISADFGNATYFISDDGTTASQLGVYRGYYLSGEKFTSTSQLKVGDKVVVYGELVNFKGNTPQFTTGSQLYSLNGATAGGDTPNPPAQSEEIYKGLVSNLDDWALLDITLPEGGTYVWSWKDYQGSGYLNGSGYLGAPKECEAYAYTAIDLTGYTAATVTFDHAAKFQTTLTTMCGLVVREQGTSAWTMLTIPTWPTAGAWTFANSGSIDLAAYAGKKIEIGFKYASTATGADTWEIKNFIVNGSK